MHAINHPSYANTGCTEQDVSKAINESVANGGDRVTLRYSVGAAEILSRECEWESDETYRYRGTDCEGRTWRVSLTES